MSEALTAPVVETPGSEALIPEVSGGQGQGADNGSAADGGQSSDSGTASESGSGDEGGKPAGDAGKDALGAPEAYEPFTVPDGVELDAGLADSITTLAKELNLPQEKAQRIVDMGLQQTQVQMEAAAKMISDAQAGWETSAKADKEIGGDASNENVAIARKTLDTFGTPALSELLLTSKLQQHPEVVRLLYRVGQAISEDKVVVGNGGPGSGSKSHAQALFPNMKNP